MLEAHPGNAKLVRFLLMAYQKLYPIGPDPALPPVPADDAFAVAMYQTTVAGTVRETSAGSGKAGPSLISHGI